MSEPERLDFLVYYRNQLKIIIEKIETQIEKASRAEKAGGFEKEDNGEAEIQKDLTDPEFLRNYMASPDILNAFNECRDLLQEVANEERQTQERLYYSNEKLGKGFAMLTASIRRVNIYFAPRLGLYEKLPDELWRELRFGKSSGDRWDKFQLTSHFQAKKAVTFLKSFLYTGEDQAVEGV